MITFRKKGNLRLTKTYYGIVLTCISAKIYNLRLLNRIISLVDSLLRKNQNGFRTNRSTTGQILTIRIMIEETRAKILATILVIDYS